MIREFDIGNFHPLESLHDSVISSMILQDNLLFLNFDHVCAETEGDEDITIGRKLHATYVLNSAFKEWDKLVCSVKHIDYRKGVKKNIIQYLTLNDMIYKLKKKNKFLSIQAQYYKKGYCLICAEVYFNGLPETGNSYYINLMVDKIVYDWVSNAKDST